MFLTSPHRLRRVALSLRLVASVAAKSLVATCAPVRTGAHEATASNSKYFANRCSQFADVRQQCCYLLRSAPNIPSTICISTSNYPTDCNRPIPCGVMQRRTALYCEQLLRMSLRVGPCDAVSTAPDCNQLRTSLNTFAARRSKATVHGLQLFLAQTQKVHG